MNKIQPALIFIAVIALVALAVFLFWPKPGPKNSSGSLNLPKAHAYKDPVIDISKIQLKIFYAVPKNQSVAPQWQDEINAVIPDVVNFHAIQFHNLSLVVPQIYPNPVILQNDDLFYDTNNTNFGNPEGLRRIVPELESRFPAFVKADRGEFATIAVVYEGVGASGSVGGMIFSRTFLEKDEYKLDRSSLFYHEFAHTFGLPDLYDLSTNVPSSDDIMGSGRYKPIETNFIGPELLADLGLSPNP